MKKMGVIGGMGPEATLDFFANVLACTPISCDQDHIPLIMDIIPQIPDRTQYLMNQGASPLPFLLESSANLVASGVSAICMPCNTAHVFTNDIREAVGVPFISIVECTLEKIQRDIPHVKRVALLATSGTHLSGIYHDAFDNAQLEIMHVDTHFQSRIMNIIYGVKGGHHEEMVAAFQECIKQLYLDKAEAIIVGCTELPLLVPYIKTDIPIVNPTMALAQAVVNFSLSSKGNEPQITMGH